MRDLSFMYRSATQRDPTGSAQERHFCMQDQQSLPALEFKSQALGHEEGGRAAEPTIHRF